MICMASPDSSAPPLPHPSGPLPSEGLAEDEQAHADAGVGEAEQGQQILPMHSTEKIGSQIGQSRPAGGLEAHTAGA